jgi:hypothetical protein
MTMARGNSALASVHKAARAVYKVNRAVRMAQAMSSGNPRRIERYAFRRLAYKLFAGLLNRVA